MRKFTLPKLWPYLALAAILALGAFLRLDDLLARDYWYDEAFTGITVRQPWGEMMRIIVNDVHPPLYYWVLKVWTMVAGSGLFALRAFSVTFGLATILVAFAALRDWHKKSVYPALVGAFVLAVNPFFVNYSQEARMYSLFAFLLILAAFLLTRVWKTGNRPLRIAYGLTLLALLLTHYLGAIFAGILVLADLWNARTKKRSIFSLSFLDGYLLTFIGGLCWLPFFATQMDARLGWVPAAGLDRIPSSLHIFLFGAPVGVSGVPPALGYQLSEISVGGMSTILIVVLTFMVAALVFQKKWDRTLLLVATLCLGPLLATLLLQYLGVNLYVERFLTGSGLFLMLFGVLALARLINQKMGSGLVALYVLLVLLVKPYTHEMPLAELDKAMRTLPQGHEVFFTDPYNFIIGKFYLGEEMTARMYAVHNPSEAINGWALVREGDQMFTLPQGPHIIVTHHPDAFAGYKEREMAGGFTILESM